LLNAFHGRKDPEIIYDKALINHWLGLADYGQNKSNDAKRHYVQAIEEINSINSDNIDTKNWIWNKTLGEFYQDFGDVLLFQLNLPIDARTAFTKSKDIRVNALDAINNLKEYEEYRHDLQHDVGWSINKLGDIELKLKHYDEALARFKEAHDKIHTLNNALWDNLLWAEHLALTDGNIGLLDIRYGQYVEGQTFLQEGESILQQILVRDPQNELHRSKLIWIYGDEGILLYRWALSGNNDMERLYMARDVLNKAIAERNKAVGYQRLSWELVAINVQAYAVAVNASIAGQEGRSEEAAQGFLDAAQLLLEKYLPSIKSNSEPNIEILAAEFLTRAGGAYFTAGKPGDARAACSRAASAVQHILNPDAAQIAQLPKVCTAE
jgi:tetratricopeptide (TPR) repeat protein